MKWTKCGKRLPNVIDYDDIDTLLPDYIKNAVDWALTKITQ